MKKKKEKSFGLHVIVEDGKFEKALRQFKKKVDESGLIKEVKDRQQFMKPTTKRKMAKNAAKKRWQKKLSLEQLPKRFY